MKLVYQYMAIFVNFSPTSSHLYPLQGIHDSNSWLVVDEDDNGKFRVDQLNMTKIVIGNFLLRHITIFVKEMDV